MVLRKRIKGNKKGSLQDIAFIIAVLFFFAFVALFGFKISSEFNDYAQSSDTITAEGKTAADSLTSMYPGVIDNAFLFLMIGLSLVILIFAALVRVHPIFMFLFIIGWIFMVFLAGVFSNIYQEAASTPELINYAGQFTFIDNLMTILPMFVGVFGIIVMVFLYKMGNPGLTQ